MPELQTRSTQTLRDLLRQTAPLDPEESLERFVRTARSMGVESLPVTLGTRFCGMAHLKDVAPILQEPDIAVREAMMRGRVGSIVVTQTPILRPDARLRDAEEICAGTGVTMLPVVEASGELCGVIMAADLLAGPVMSAIEPPRMGGMATLRGVYLTNGAIQAGVGNGALVGTGFVLGAFSGLTGLLLTGMITAAAKIWPRAGMLSTDTTVPAGHPLLAVASVAVTFLGMSVFMLLMRASRLGGFHAAEHQTIHAVERGEQLHPDIVARMPRPHPRCGTNLLAATFLFVGAMQMMLSLRGMDPVSAALPSALVALIFWRRFGTFLQSHFTTRPARVKELNSGIAAANELMARYRKAPPGRIRVLRRIWCSGLIQSLMGFGLFYGLAAAAGAAWQYCMGRSITLF